MLPDQVVLSKILYALSNLREYTSDITTRKQLNQSLDCMINYIIDNSSIDVIKLEKKIELTQIEEIIEID